MIEDLNVPIESFERRDSRSISAMTEREKHQNSTQHTCDVVFRRVVRVFGVRLLQRFVVTHSIMEREESKEECKHEEHRNDDVFPWKPIHLSVLSKHNITSQRRKRPHRGTCQHVSQ